MAYYKSGGINVTSNSNVSINTASGSIASFNTNLSMPVLETKATINPIQNGTPWIDSNEVNKVPYIKRTVAGTATRIGNHLYDKLVGGTVAFNQLVESISYSGGGITITTNADNEIVINGTATETAYAWINNTATYSVVNHVYLVTLTKALDGVLIYNDNGGVLCGYPNTATIGKATANNRFYLRVYNGSSFNNDKTKANIIDLTQKFGSTIADYIYSLEQATAGAGVAFFRNLFPNDYYAYNAGELMSVKATAHVMKNASNQIIGNYALDSNLELRGLFKLDANNKLYADGDTYESSGAVTRRFRLFNCAVDTFEVTKNVSSDNTDWLYYFICYDISDDSVPTDVFSQTFKTVDYAPTRQNGKKCCLNKHFHVIYINMYGLISTNDEATAKQWLVDNAVKFLYKKTPTTEQATPFTNPQVCDENGTEEYTDSRAVAIPVGHETYQANICEITGFDELNIQRCGVNLWGGETMADAFVDADNYYKNTTTKTFTFSAYEVEPYYLTLFNKFKANTQYTIILRYSAVTNNNSIRILYSDRTSLALQLLATNAKTDFVVTTPAGKTISEIFLTYYSAGVVTVYYDESGVFEGVKTIDDFNSYSGKLIKLEFDDTVYLAEVSCLNGVWKLTSKYARDKINDLEISTGSYEGVDYFIYNQPLKKIGGQNIISDIFVTSSEGGVPNMPNNSILGSNSNPYVFIRADEFTTVSELKNSVGNNYIYYELATLIEITLDETEQFEALLGVNNVWHDANGNTEVKYRKVNIQ